MPKRDDDDDPVTKTDFVWAMVQLGLLDRNAYRKLREAAWKAAAEEGSVLGKSELAN
jgi:hypothetical protein